jgi:hypothetical protein
MNNFWILEGFLCTAILLTGISMLFWGNGD